MNCHKYTYDTIPEILRANIDEQLFNYIKTYWIERSKIDKEYRRAATMASRVKYEWQLAVQASPNEDVSDIDYAYEPRYMEHHINEQNLNDVLDARDADYGFNMEQSGFGYRKLKRMDTRIIAFINDGHVSM